MAATRNARKPAHLEMVGGKNKRQRIWEYIRQSREGFAVSEAAWKAHVDGDTTRTYFQSLENGSYITVINPVRGPQEEKRYRLERDTGLEAPRLTRSGQPVTQGLAQEQMWRAMRILSGDFSFPELAALASTPEVAVSPAAAQCYLKHLAKAGYVTLVQKSMSRVGTGRTPSRYRFSTSRYTGPRPPMIQRSKSVYDPNLDKVVWQEEMNHDDL
ncbi:hypothetical protein ACPRNU_02025 [Chromobacterium vaccinii]|uniref:hypothetical protein n=1 Tax=Chromobacterium vaccinii TaxID=1108595 RepID=UPI003C786647